MVDETLLTTDQVLAYLRVDLRTVYRLIETGKIPAVKVGRQWRFRETEIDVWLERERSHSIPPVVSSVTSAEPAKPDGRPRVLVVDDEAPLAYTPLEAAASSSRGPGRERLPRPPPLDGTRPRRPDR